MKKILIPAFMILLSCVNSPVDDKQGLICYGSKEIDRLIIEFAFTGSNPVMPKLEIENIEVNYCSNSYAEDYCINKLETASGKITYTITAWKTPAENLNVTLFDNTVHRLSRNGEEMTSQISRPEDPCANGYIYSLKIQE